MKAPLRVLHLDDDPREAHRAKAILAADGILCKSLRAETRSEFVAAIASAGINLILAGHRSRALAPAPEQGCVP